MDKNLKLMIIKMLTRLERIVEEPSKKLYRKIENIKHNQRKRKQEMK